MRSMPPLPLLKESIQIRMKLITKFEQIPSSSEQVGSNCRKTAFPKRAKALENASTCHVKRSMLVFGDNSETVCVERINHVFHRLT